VSDVVRPAPLLKQLQAANGVPKAYGLRSFENQSCCS
jgi:hypothetical protein